MIDFLPAVDQLRLKRRISLRDRFAKLGLHLLADPLAAEDHAGFFFFDSGDVGKPLEDRSDRIAADADDLAVYKRDLFAFPAADLVIGIIPRSRRLRQ